VAMLERMAEKNSRLIRNLCFRPSNHLTRFGNGVFHTRYQTRRYVGLRTGLHVVVNRTPVVHAVLNIILTLATPSTKTYIYVKHIYAVDLIGWKSPCCLVKTKRKHHYKQHHINL